jgi:tripartite-type tricarboxylate transporter receptor subunit TctC
MTINVSLYQKLPYHPRDFAPITLGFTSPQFLVANPRVPVSSVAELVAYAKANPAKLSYGSSGLGTASHLQMEMFKRSAGIELLHVAYKGAGPAMNDVIAGEVQVAAQLISNVLSNVKSGRLMALGVIGPKRSPSAPGVPTFAEAGFPGYEFELETWVGVMAPAATPKPIIERYNREMVRILRLPEVQTQFKVQELDTVANSPEEFAEFIRVQIERWGQIVKVVGIRLD